MVKSAITYKTSAGLARESLEHFNSEDAAISTLSA